MEYGMLSDEKFFERAEKFALLKNTDGKYFNFEDYKKAIEPTQTDKDKKLVYLYTTNTVDQYTYIEAAKSKGYDVLIFDNQLDSHYVNLLESKFKDSTFTRVDADIIDNLIKKEDLSKPDLSAIEIEDLNAMIQPLMPSSANYQVTAANLGETGSPILITQSEFMRRYREMSKLGGQMNYFGEMPESYSITVNAEQPLIKTILEKKEKSTAAKADELEKKNNELQTSLDKINAETKDKKDEEISTETKDEKKRLEDEISKVKDSRKSIMADFAKDNTLLKQVIDLALLANNMLKGKALNDFITRSTQVLKK